MLKITSFARYRHDAVVFRGNKLQHPVNEIAERVGEIVVHVGGKTLEGERRVAALRRIRREPPAPIVRRQQIKCLVKKNAAVLARGEFLTLISEPRDALDHVDGLPRFAGSQQRAWK